MYEGLGNYLLLQQNDFIYQNNTFVFVHFYHGNGSKARSTFGWLNERHGQGKFCSAHSAGHHCCPIPLFRNGPLGRMQGEITVLNGKPFGASVNEKGEGVVQENWKIEAPFFVYANVQKWKSYKFNVEVKNLDDLQKAIAQISQQNGYDLQQSFPFRLVGNIAQLTTHIVMPRSPEIVGYQPNKNQANYDLSNQKGELLGFYSEKNQGIYTPKNSYIHVHFVSKDQKIMGHIDKIQTESGELKLYLPIK